MLKQHLCYDRAHHWLLAKQAVKVACGQAAPTCYGNMDLMFANMVSSGLCVPIHQPQTHLCNLGGNLSEKRWAAESPPHCLAGPDEISKHTAVQVSALVSPQTQVAEVCQGMRQGNKLQDTFFWWYFSRDVEWMWFSLCSFPPKTSKQKLLYPYFYINDHINRFMWKVSLIVTTS